MKKTFRFLTLTFVMAITASVAVPAFAATPKADRENAPSFFLTFIYDQSPSLIVTEEQALSPTATSYTWNLLTPEIDLKDDNK